MRRAIKAARSAGIDIARVDVNDGGFAIIPGRVVETAASDETRPNEWDEVLIDASEQKRAS